MREMHLFSGIGGGILGGLLLGHAPVCAVEIDPYCRKVLRARQVDGCLPEFPLFDDVREFDGLAWRGRCDVVAGGFPCTGFSVAGKRQGFADAGSSLWFEMLRVVREVGPRYVFVENSPRLVRTGLGTVLGGLADLGFDAEWLVLSAADCGAPHLRKRLWLLAKNPDADSGGLEKLEERDIGAPAGQQAPQRDDAVGLRPDVPDTDVCGFAGTGAEASPTASRAAAERVRPHVADTGGQGLPVSEQEELCGPGRRHEGRATAQRGWWSVEPRVRRVAHGIPHRVGGIHALGNAQVPVVAAQAFRLLQQRLG